MNPVSSVSLQHEINSSTTSKPAAQSFVFQKATQADAVAPVQWLVQDCVCVCWEKGLLKLQHENVRDVQVFPGQRGLWKDCR